MKRLGLVFIGVVLLVLLGAEPIDETSAQVPPRDPPARDCTCHDLTVSLKKIPTAEGAISGEGEGKVYEVTVTSDWTKVIRCNGAMGTCTGKVSLSTSSSDWKIDGKKGEVVADSESHKSGGSTDVPCNGKCTEAEDPEANPPEDFSSEYKVKVKKTKGGIITTFVEGTITLTATPKDCPGTAWTAKLHYKSNLKKLEAEIDPNFSDLDGDGLNGIMERARRTDPLDSDSDNDGFKDGNDRHPTNPNKH